TSGIAKLTDPSGAMGFMTKAGVPHADVMVYVAAVAEIVGGLAVLFGFLARLGAAGLFVYLAVVSYFMHRFWAVPAEESRMQLVNFMKNLCIMGGLAMVVAFGPGRYSIDGLLRRPKAA